jgi:hydroxybutyrate-dimer hydrolase
MIGSPSSLRLACFAAVALALASCGGASNNDSAPGNGNVNTKPSYIGTVSTAAYDGTSDDLLTAGLGKTGLAGAAPAIANTAAPTAAELRRSAIYNNYRALVDMTAAGGYGTLYGPNVSVNGTAGSGEGKIAGVEYLAYSDDGSGRQNVTMLVQIPANFDRSNACILAAPSSGSRGVYGAISVGEWGLKRGCAVAYTDKGTGAAAYDPMTDTVALIDGTRSTSSAAGNRAHFRPVLSDAERTAFNTATPNRLAFKHAHSQRNPEKDWGRFVLQSIEFAFWALNDRHGDQLPSGERVRTITPANTTVIAGAVSNGGGAVLAAAEQDASGWIDGVVASEPHVNLPSGLQINVRQGNTNFAVRGRPLIDYVTLGNMLQICAALATDATGSPGAGLLVPTFAANRCAALQAAGILTGTSTVELANQALQQLRDYGWLRDSDVIHASLAALEVPSSVSVTFANALSRSSVANHLCGYSFAATTAAGAVTAVPAATLAGLFGTGNGIPPNSGIQLVNNANPGGPLRDPFSESPSSGLADYNLDGALCLRSLLTGSDTVARALQAGLAETIRNGNLRGKPALVMHGRADALIPVNHSSRPYYGYNKAVESIQSKLSYIEVTNAQHFDSFIGLPSVLPGYDSRFVPLHVYMNRGLEAMYANLKSGTALPPSQVVRTVPRGGSAGAAPAITAANVPAFSTAPAVGDLITYSAGTVNVPD